MTRLFCRNSRARCWSTCGKRGVDHKLVVMPCGHYTLGEAPFKFVAGYQICSFLKRNL